MKKEPLATCNRSVVISSMNRPVYLPVNNEKMRAGSLLYTRYHHSTAHSSHDAMTRIYTQY